MYSYRGQLKRTVIGVPYVEDLDDWDVVDKSFQLVKSENQYFHLQEKQVGNHEKLEKYKYHPNGILQLVIDADLPEGIYELEVKVEDKVRNERAMSFIKVIVRAVPEIAFEKHVSDQGLSHGLPLESTILLLTSSNLAQNIDVLMIDPLFNSGDHPSGGGPSTARNLRTAR